MPIDFTPDVDVSAIVDGQDIDAADFAVPFADLVTILNALANGSQHFESIYLKKASGDVTLELSGAAGTTRGLELQTADVSHWGIYANNVAQSGSNAGGDLMIVRKDDSGADLETVICINRANGTVSIANYVDIGSSDLFVDASGNVLMGAYSVGTSGARVLLISNGTAPASSPANAIQLYATSGELRVRDEAGNVTTLSPHNPQMFDASGRLTDYVHKEFNPTTGQDIELDIYGALQWVESESGQTFIHSRSLPPKLRENPYRNRVLNKRQAIRQRVQSNE